MRKILFLAVTHISTLAIGFGLGIYLLPILIAPASPDRASLDEMAANALFKSEFTRDLKGSDFLHWGEGEISLSPSQIIHKGSLAPGPDYKLYLVKEFVENEDEFLAIKQQANLVGDVKTFEGFILNIPPQIDIADFKTVVIWCETFSEFITAAKYQ